MNARWLFLCSALLLFANGAYAKGTYQRTKDGKTFVWNNRPRSGDAATWSGHRDTNGYATGHGALTWYTTDRVILTGSILPSAKHIAVSRYSGNMVRGKLNGPVVNMDANGKKFHGTFVDGRKAHDWAAGPARGPGRTGIAPDQRREEQVHRDVVAEPQAPAEGPSSVQSSEVRGQRPEITDRPAYQKAKISEPAIREMPSPAVNDSLRSLVSPPSLLRTNVIAEASPQASIPPTASSSPAAVPRLTAADVIELADAEAHRQGYNPGEYQRPQADYTAADETWSVSYDQMYADGVGKHFSVSVEDKTKKTSIVAGR